MKKLLSLLITPILFWQSPNFASDNSNPEKALLSSAIKIYSSISPEEDVKSRISKRESTLKKIDEIIESYSNTDTGLELISTGSFGKFNIEKIRKTYLSELIDFNLKTCGSIPSFNCLGYVSLDNGNKTCNNASSFSQYLSASNNFKNAYKIFKSQGDSINNELVVLSSYRNCANSAKSTFGKDFINSRLINVMLDSGDESKAIGLTQNMKTPLFKILAAADIRVYKNKYDYSTFNKLVEKSKSLATPKDRESALINLANKLFSVNLNPLSDYADFDLSSRNVPGCDEKDKYLAEISMDFILNKAKSDYWMTYDDRPSTELAIYSNADRCNTYNTRPIGFYIGQRDIKTAENIKDFQSNRGTDQNLLAIHLTKILSTEDIIKYYSTSKLGWENWLKAYSKIVPDKRKLRKKENTFYPFADKFGKNIIFKSMIDGNQVCDASEILFKDLRGTQYEVEAVSYFITSPTISNDKKYECGDADLDLLIN